MGVEILDGKGPTLGEGDMFTAWGRGLGKRVSRGGGEEEDRGMVGKGHGVN